MLNLLKLIYNFNERFCLLVGVTMTMDPVCTFCGDLEVSDGDIVKQLKTEYGIVRPICNKCINEGKKPIVRNALKIKKSRTK